MKINLPWDRMQQEEQMLWDKFLENYGYEMEDEELMLLEQSYKNLTGNENFKIQNLMMFGRAKDEEQSAAGDLFGISKF